MSIRPIQRLGRKALFGSGSLAGLLLGWSGAGALNAQTPLPMEIVEKTVPIQETAPVQRNFLNKSVIQLPIQIGESARSLIQEIHLYVKESAAAPWAERGKVGPAEKAFTYQVPHDGEYWFTMVTVDKQGRSFPADLRNEPPGLVVVIDTQRPQVELTNVGQAPEGQLVQCDVRDANLDFAKMRFYFQGGDKIFRPLDAVPGRANLYCIPAQAVSTGMIRVRAVDLAGNETVCEEQISKLKVIETAHAAKEIKTPAEQTPPKLPPDLMRTPPDLKSSDAHQAQKPAPDNSAKPVEFRRPDGSEGPHFPMTEDNGPKLPTPAQESMKRQIVNSTKVFLDYQIENAAQSSAAKVEVWLTRDLGKSWQKISEDSQRKNPLEVLLPGEGLFGLTLVASNGRGSPVPPSSGQTPDWWIEVDTTNPSAQITKVETVHEAGQHVVHIHWSAHDKNLAEGPVDLFYAATPQGPWLLIAKGLPAQGQHRWAAPKEVGAQAHLRLVVRDQAGNSGICNTLDPVQITEPVPPRAIIRNISTGAPTAVPIPVPQGN